MIDKIEALWDELAEIAIEHSKKIAEFQLMSEKRYKFRFNDLPYLQDNDDIIDTIDDGTASLSFAEFDELMKQGIIEFEQGKIIEGLISEMIYG